MMEPPGGTALVEESLHEAIDFRRAMHKVDEEFGDDDWWFKVWGPLPKSDEGVGDRDDWVIHEDDTWHGFGRIESGFNMLDPIKSTIITPGLNLDGEFDEDGIPAAIVSKYLAEHGIIIEKTGLYSFFIMFTIGITKGRWNSMVTEGFVDWRMKSTQTTCLTRACDCSFRRSQMQASKLRDDVKN